MKRIFISCPISKYSDDDQISEDYKGFIKKIFNLCKNSSESVYLALERENYEIKQMKNDDICTLQDYKAICNADIVVAIPEDSQGVAVEIGWASALDKKIILVLDQIYTYSALIKAINVVTDAIIVNIERKDEYSSVDNIFFEKLSQILKNI